jgi:hypothetical protein
VDIYGEHMFVPTNKLSWDDQYAPKDWNYERFGRPDVVEMERRAQGPEQYAPETKDVPIPKKKGTAKVTKKRKKK